MRLMRRSTKRRTSARRTSARRTFKTIDAVEANGRPEGEELSDEVKKEIRDLYLKVGLTVREIERSVGLPGDPRVWAYIRTVLHSPVDLEPNRASTLGGRAAMDTKFGKNIDPDRYNGKRGNDLDAAMDRYEVFHAKRPLRTVDLGHELPSRVVPIGQCVSTMYRTDKWHKDGDDEDYKHVHDNSRGGKDKEYEFGKGVIAYEPVQHAGKSRVEGRRVKANESAAPVALPVKKPEAVTLLGYCLGVFVRRFDDGEVYEINPRGCYLFCSPKGDMLALYSPEEQPDGSRGFLMVMAGGGLRVLKDGIDG